jgi:hypothetical protein
MNVYVLTLSNTNVQHEFPYLLRETTSKLLMLAMTEHDNLNIPDSAAHLDLNLTFQQHFQFQINLNVS